MNVQKIIINLLVNIIPVISIIYIFVGIKLIKQNYKHSKNYFSMLMFTSAIYSFGYFLELNCQSYEFLLPIRFFEFLGAVFIPAFGILFIADLVKVKVSKTVNISLYIISAALWLVFITDPVFHLIYKSIELHVIEGFGIVRTVKGPLYYSMMIYYVIFLFFSIIVLINEYRNTNDKNKKSSFILILLTLQIPWLSILIVIFGLNTNIDPVPPTIMIICIFISLIEHSNDIFKLEVKRWNIMYSNLSEPAILIDKDNNLVSSNTMANILIKSQKITSADILVQINQYKNHENPVTFTIDKERRWFDVNISKFDNKNKFTNYLLVDITDRIITAETLKKSEEKFSKAFHANASLMAIMTIDEQIYTDVNETFLRTLGYERGEVIGKNSFDLNYFVEIESKRKIMLEYEKHGKAQNIDVQIKNKKGEILNGIYSIESIDIGDTPCYITTISDITFQKKIEQQLLLKQRLLKAIAESTNELLSNRDITGAITHCLRSIGQATNVERVYLFKNESISNDLPAAIKQAIEWNSGFLDSHIGNQKFQNISDFEILELFASLVQKDPFVGVIKSLPPSKTKTYLEGQQILSILVLPIFVDEEFWGFVGLDECKFEREWMDDEIALLMSFANSISGAISRNNSDSQIEFLSYHDQLTGLYNRRFYEQELIRLDISENLPISIIMGDVNGLKLINDSFGHQMGDLLLKKVGELITKSTRENDIVARLGGDEFIIILPRTDASRTENVINRIKELTKNEKIGGIDISISCGYEIKKTMDQDILEIFKNTEDHMYRHKLHESSSVRSNTIDIIINTLYEKNRREMLHSKRVSELCEMIATKMNFEKDHVNRIKVAGLLHDIGKIGIDENILNKPRELSNDEFKEIERHSEIGYRILSSVNEFSDIANYILEHHEKWDGQGYPKRLKGEEISLQARIIAVADAYDAMTSERSYSEAISKEEAILEIQKCSGTQFDPQIAKIFTENI